MKNLRVFILIAVFVFLGCAMNPINIITKAYTYDGDVDPGEFGKWRVVDSWGCSRGHLHILFINTYDKASGVSMAETMSTPDKGEAFRIIKYRYLKGGTVYVFSFNERTYNYDQQDKAMNGWASLEKA